MPTLRSVTRARPALIAGMAIPAAVSLALAVPASAATNVSLIKVSHDIYTDSQAQHKTEVEPDVFSFGSTIVSAFQVGRVFGGGSSNIGWATSKNGGATWSHGFLPGITTNGGGTFGQASDASVAFDAKAKTWLITSLGISGNSVPVLVSRSTNGGTAWGKPVTIASGNTDKEWIVCDNTTTSPHFGNCYVEYDVPGGGDSEQMRTSTDGGATWGPALAPGGTHTGLGGQPVVLPNGDVVVPYESLNSQIRSFNSVNGGSSWNTPVLVSSISHHTVAGSLREEPLPSAEADAAGTVYVTWADCRFRSGCPRNDIVLAKSTSETTWAAPVRVPIDAVSSTDDHFTPGIGVDAASSGASARIGLSYYFYPASNCTSSTCQLDAGYISSVNGGTSWSAATQVAGPMSLSWIPNTSQGRMFGDYISTSVVPGGNAYPVLPVSSAPTGSSFNQAMFAPAGGLAVTGGGNTAPASDQRPAAPASPASAAPVTARLPVTPGPGRGPARAFAGFRRFPAAFGIRADCCARCPLWTTSYIQPNDPYAEELMDNGSSDVFYINTLYTCQSAPYPDSSLPNYGIDFNSYYNSRQWYNCLDRNGAYPIQEAGQGTSYDIATTVPPGLTS